MLFQNYALFPHMTVTENVAFGLQMRKFSKSECEAKVLKALDLVQLQQYRDRLPSQLSGGQQQRVALARALVIEPAMLLLDEPLGALDKSLRESMQVEIRTLQQRLGLTTIMVTHDQDEALTMADQIAVMNGGRLEQIASAADIYQKPATRFVAGFIGASNFFTGRVEPRADGAAQLVTASGVVVPMVPGTVAHNDVTITVRPESINVQPLGTPSGLLSDAVQANVEQVVYRGYIHHYYLRLDSGEQVIAYRQSQADHPGGDCAAGDRVQLSWNAASNHVVSA
jgi:ABC-type Fe3+/spermidine/putrescine transport system ATPase subunit